MNHKDGRIYEVRKHFTSKIQEFRRKQRVSKAAGVTLLLGLGCQRSCFFRIQNSGIQLVVWKLLSCRSWGVHSSCWIGNLTLKHVRQKVIHDHRLPYARWTQHVFICRLSRTRRKKSRRGLKHARNLTSYEIIRQSKLHHGRELQRRNGLPASFQKHNQGVSRNNTAFYTLWHTSMNFYLGTLLWVYSTCTTSSIAVHVHLVYCGEISQNRLSNRGCLKAICSTPHIELFSFDPRKRGGEYLKPSPPPNALLNAA